MSIKRALNKESSYEISLKLDEKCSRGISYSSQIVFFQSLHYTCFSSATCPLQVPDNNVASIPKNPEDKSHRVIVALICREISVSYWELKTVTSNFNF